MHNIKLRWIRDEDPEEHSTENWQVFWNGSFVQVAGACPRCGAGDQTEYTSIDDGDLGTFADELPPPFNVPDVPRRRIRETSDGGRAAHAVPLWRGCSCQGNGLLTRVFQQLKTYAALSRLLLTTGLLCVVLGLGALLVASWKTWIPGSSDPPAAESICISVDGAVVAKVKANSLDVEELTGAQLAPCR